MADKTGGYNLSCHETIPVTSPIVLYKCESVTHLSVNVNDWEEARWYIVLLALQYCTIKGEVDGAHSGVSLLPPYSCYITHFNRAV